MPPTEGITNLQGKEETQICCSGAFSALSPWSDIPRVHVNLDSVTVTQIGWTPGQTQSVSCWVYVSLLEVIKHLGGLSRNQQPASPGDTPSSHQSVF